MRAPTLAGCLLVAALAAVTALPAPALAHEGNPDYRSEITGFDPPAPGVEVEVLNFDDSLQLRNEGDETVVVDGYQGEPYVRISPDGTVEVNERSPSFYLNQDRFAEASVPDSADPDAPPDWQLVDESGQYTWHDHRSHYMGSGTPPQVSDESLRTKVFDYAIPLRVGSTDTEAQRHPLLGRRRRRIPAGALHRPRGRGAADPCNRRHRPPAPAKPRAGPR